MIEGAQQSSFAIHREIPRGPNCWRTYITREYCILGGKLIDDAGSKLWMDRLLAVMGNRQFVEILACLAVVLDRPHQMCRVLVLLQSWQERSECSLGVSDKTIVDPGPTSQLFTPKIDLHDGRVLGKELLVGKVSPNH